MNINNLMKQAKQMQNKVLQIQAELEKETVESSVGGGMVTAVFTGQSKLVSIKIDPEVVNPEDVEMLEDLVTSAVREGLEKSRKLAEERMGVLAGAMGMGF